MDLTLVSLATDLSSFTWKEKGIVNQPLYSNAIVQYKKNGASSYSQKVQMAYNDANWLLLFGVNGLQINVPATDGVHLFQLLLAKSTNNISVSALGVISGIVLTGYDYISVPGAPYILYPIVNGVAAGFPTTVNGTVLLWSTDTNGALVIVGAENALAADLRAMSTLSCEGTKSLLGRYINLQSAIVRFNCGDYDGADWLVNNNTAVTENCNC